jgi:hypothetical protein
MFEASIAVLVALVVLMLVIVVVCVVDFMCAGEALIDSFLDWKERRGKGSDSKPGKK